MDATFARGIEPDECTFVGPETSAQAFCQIAVQRRGKPLGTLDASRGVGALIQRGGRAVAGMLTIATALLHDSTAARVGALFQLLVQDTTAQDFGLPSSAIRLRM